MHHSDYDPSLAAAVVNEAAGLLRSVGFAADHLILIGGIVPGLLVPTLDPGIEPHIGTTDLDFCLSVAIVEGDTAEYERIEQGLRQAGFTAEESWHWPGGPAAAATAVRVSSVFGHSEMPRALEILADQFRDLDRAGARAYARFTENEGTDPDLLARRAVGAVREFLAEVRRA